MESNVWEYCKLVVTYHEWLTPMFRSDLSLKEREKLVEKAYKNKQPGYKCGIHYLCQSAEFFHQPLTFQTPITDDPFDLALGLLGGSGWELVSLQHGNLVITVEGTPGSFAIQEKKEYKNTLTENRVAYLKRPVKDGRAVNEPIINLSLFKVYDAG